MNTHDASAERATAFSTPHRAGGHSLFLFFALAYTFSWLVEIPLALRAQGLLGVPVPFELHYLAAYGPLLSAVVVTWREDGAEGLKELTGRMLKWRVRAWWWPVALAPLLLYGLLAGALRLVQGQGPGLSGLGQVSFLPSLGLAALPFWILTFGIGEETGWRGFALPRLQRGRSALSASLILWLLWALWHLPLFFYSYDATVLPGMLMGLLAGAIVFTWLYNSTSGSILLVAVWHGAFNYTTACVTCGEGMVPAVLSALVMVWAVVLVVLLRPARLSQEEKQVL